MCVYCKWREKLENDVSADIREILTQYKTVAIVGVSPKPERDSYKVASFLKQQGYKMIPVTPNAKEVLGEPTYPDIISIPVDVDVVDIFRRPEEVLPVVEQAISIGARVVWMQEGIVNEEAATRARKAGLKVIMNHCMRKELLRLLGREDEI